MATASGNGGGDRTAEAVVAGQISQAVNSTANLLHLIRQSSSAKLAKLPKNLLAKASLTKATGQVCVGAASSSDFIAGCPYIESGLNSSRTAPRFDDFVLSSLPSMFPHLVAPFIVACVSMTLPFAMFATQGVGFRSPSLRLFSYALASLSISVRY
ncbi:hypothetical protein HID58_067090 [Brassica napus]|uniref:Uncharacterized protein n=1 Tax=Brassica napus TaxID=3708 RepID=A0ABQ7ZI35_BRANA|nr:hypothetical protein HID58_067090 [Brassica napus]